MKNGFLFWIESKSGEVSMLDDVILNKSEIIERCIRRIHEEYDGDPKNLENITRQDSIILNLQRACKAATYAGTHGTRPGSYDLINRIL